MEDCEVRDDWSPMCSPVLSTELIQFFSVCFCAMVALIVVLWALYAACLSQMGRPMFRVWSFTLATLGFVLSTPQAFVRIKDPSLLPTEDAVLLTSFVLGDVMNHIALLMIIYWDICRESVMLIFALDPAKQTKSLRLSFGVGSGFMLSQVAILGTFLPLMAFLEDTSRGLTISIFYVGQVSFIFGFAPPVAFGLLARSFAEALGRVATGSSKETCPPPALCPIGPLPALAGMPRLCTLRALSGDYTRAERLGWLHLYIYRHAGRRRRRGTFAGWGIDIDTKAVCEAKLAKRSLLLRSRWSR